MATVILVRHGETDWNRDKIFRGRADIPLGEQGKKQAERVAEALKECRLAALYSSPLSRSMQTAEAIARHQACPVTELEEISDIDYGDWQGKPLKEVLAEYPDLCALWESAPDKARIPRGESLRGVQDRALPKVLQIAADHSGPIAVVSHRVVLKVVILGLLGLGVERFWSLKLDTCGVTIFDITQERKTLVRFNDVGHLAGLRDEAAADF